MIPTTEVELLLRGWQDSKGILRVTADLEGMKFSAFCRIYEVTADGLCLTIGSDELNKVAFLFEGWAFEFTDLPREDDRTLPVGGVVESVIVWLKSSSSMTLMLLEQ
ncbi:MAG: hypothetical protein ACLPY1_18430 [Terracidiphilus sp.]